MARFFLSLFVVACVLFATGHAQSTTGLRALYDATGGPTWTEASGWDGSSNDPCDGSWFGVYCEDGEVVGLLLSNNNLTGSVPAELRNLPNSVRGIDLAHNQLQAWPAPLDSSIDSEGHDEWTDFLIWLVDRSLANGEGFLAVEGNPIACPPEASKPWRAGRLAVQYLTCVCPLGAQPVRAFSKDVVNCVACPEGHYSDLISDEPCFRCPDGWTTDSSVRLPEDENPDGVSSFINCIECDREEGCPLLAAELNGLILEAGVTLIALAIAWSAIACSIRKDRRYLSVNNDEEYQARVDFTNARRSRNILVGTILFFAVAAVVVTFSIIPGEGVSHDVFVLTGAALQGDDFPPLRHLDSAAYSEVALIAGSTSGSSFNQSVWGGPAFLFKVNTTDLDGPPKILENPTGYTFMSSSWGGVQVETSPSGIDRQVVMSGVQLVADGEEQALEMSSMAILYINEDGKGFDGKALYPAFFNATEEYRNSSGVYHAALDWPLIPENLFVIERPHYIIDTLVFTNTETFSGPGGVRVTQVSFAFITETNILLFAVIVDDTDGLEDRVFPGEPTPVLLDAYSAPKNYRFTAPQRTAYDHGSLDMFVAMHTDRRFQNTRRFDRYTSTEPLSSSTSRTLYTRDEWRQFEALDKDLYEGREPWPWSDIFAADGHGGGAGGSSDAPTYVNQCFHAHYGSSQDVDDSLIADGKFDPYSEEDCFDSLVIIRPHVSNSTTYNSTGLTGFLEPRLENHATRSIHIRTGEMDIHGPGPDYFYYAASYFHLEKHLYRNDLNGPAALVFQEMIRIDPFAAPYGTNTMGFNTANPPDIVRLYFTELEGGRLNRDEVSADESRLAVVDLNPPDSAPGFPEAGKMRLVRRTNYAPGTEELGAYTPVLNSNGAWENGILALKGSITDSAEYAVGFVTVEGTEKDNGPLVGAVATQVFLLLLVAFSFYYAYPHVNRFPIGTRSQRVRKYGPNYGRMVGLIWEWAQLSSFAFNPSTVDWGSITIVPAFFAASNFSVSTLSVYLDLNPELVSFLSFILLALASVLSVLFFLGAYHLVYHVAPRSAFAPRRTSTGGGLWRFLTPVSVNIVPIFASALVLPVTRLLLAAFDCQYDLQTVRSFLDDGSTVDSGRLECFAISPREWVDASGSTTGAFPDLPHWLYLILSGAGLLLYLPMASRVQGVAQFMRRAIDIRFHPPYLFWVLQLKFGVAAAGTFLDEYPGLILPTLGFFCLALVSITIYYKPSNVPFINRWRCAGFTGAGVAVAVAWLTVSSGLSGTAPVLTLLAAWFVTLIVFEYVLPDSLFTNPNSDPSGTHPWELEDSHGDKATGDFDDSGVSGVRKHEDHVYAESLSKATIYVGYISRLLLAVCSAGLIVLLYPGGPGDTLSSSVKQPALTFCVVGGSITLIILWYISTHASALYAARLFTTVLEEVDWESKSKDDGFSPNVRVFSKHESYSREIEGELARMEAAGRALRGTADITPLVQRRKALEKLLPQVVKLEKERAHHLEHISAHELRMKHLSGSAAPSKAAVMQAEIVESQKAADELTRQLDALMGTVPATPDLHGAGSPKITRAEHTKLHAIDMGDIDNPPPEALAAAGESDNVPGSDPAAVLPVLPPPPDLKKDE